MAKKKLFGNHVEPRCEICALGMVSSDGETVLCRHAGAPLKYHSCKKFRYDPLKRIPHREPTLETFNASDFSLMDPADELMEPVHNEEPADDPVHEAMLSTLRTYLDTTDSPNADDILQLLSASNEAPDNVEDIVDEDTIDEETIVEEAIAEETAADTVEADEALPDEMLHDALLEDVSESEPDVAVNDEVIEQPPVESDTIDFDDPDYKPSTFLASEEDIRRDMEQFTVELHKGASTRAAFNNFAVEFHDAREDDEPEDEPASVITPTENATVFLDVESENAFGATLDSEDPLLSDDLLFLNLDHLNEETIESLVLNEDGTLSTMTEEL